MTDATILILAAILVLEIKHYVCDYVFQTPYMFLNKGIYGHPGGMLHAGFHALASIPVFLVITPGLGLAVAIIVGEFIVHYHMDWLKEYLGKRHQLTPKDGGYWRIYGLDQLVHHVTYVVMVGLLVAA